MIYEIFERISSLITKSLFCSDGRNRRAVIRRLGFIQPSHPMKKPQNPRLGYVFPLLLSCFQISGGMVLRPYRTREVSSSNPTEEYFSLFNNPLPLEFHQVHYCIHQIESNEPVFRIHTYKLMSSRLKAKKNLP